MHMWMHPQYEESSKAPSERAQFLKMVIVLIPKQPDSLKTVAALSSGVAHGAVTLSDMPLQVNFDSTGQGPAASPGHNSLASTARDFRLEPLPTSLAVTA